MKVIVGLGNPGSQYTMTRHNVGFMVVDRLAEACGADAVKSKFQSAVREASVGSVRCLLVKPLTYMNRSGQAIAEVLGFYKADPAADLLVVVDDLYLPGGSVRLKPGGGTGGHNGLEDIRRALGSDDYPRLRVGVGLTPDGGKPPQMDQADFVLSRFSADDEPIVAAAVKRATEGARAWASKGLAAAMNLVNAPSDGARPHRPAPTPRQSTAAGSPVDTKAITTETKLPHGGEERK